MGIGRNSTTRGPQVPLTSGTFRVPFFDPQPYVHVHLENPEWRLSAFCRIPSKNSFSFQKRLWDTCLEQGSAKSAFVSPKHACIRRLMLSSKKRSANEVTPLQKSVAAPFLVRMNPRLALAWRGRGIPFMARFLGK